MGFYSQHASSPWVTKTSFNKKWFRLDLSSSKRVLQGAALKSPKDSESRRIKLVVKVFFHSVSQYFLFLRVISHLAAWNLIPSPIRLTTHTEFHEPLGLRNANEER